MKYRRSRTGTIKYWTLDYPCFTGPEPRRAYVYLPASYYTSRFRRFPVLYMFDGHNVFYDSHATYGKSWGLGEYLNKIKAPVIVAAIECNSSPNNGRLSEYSPYDFNDEQFGGPFKGRGEETMQWFINEFKPFIDENLKTLPDRKHTFIAGSSMGGLMTLYALAAHNDVFSRGMALSPSFFVDMDSLTKEIRRSKMSSDTVLYMDYGQNEFKFSPDSRKNFADITNELLKKNVMLTARIVPNGNHSEASWEKQLPLCINTLLYEVK